MKSRLGDPGGVRCMGLRLFTCVVVIAVRFLGHFIFPDEVRHNRFQYGKKRVPIFSRKIHEGTNEVAENLVERLPQVASIFGNALARRHAEAQLQTQLAFEMLLADLSARFVNPSPADIDAEIEGALAKLGAFFKAERVIIAPFSGEENETQDSLTRGWVAPSGFSRSQKGTKASIEI